MEKKYNIPKGYKVMSEAKIPKYGKYVLIFNKKTGQKYVCRFYGKDNQPTNFGELY